MDEHTRNRSVAVHQTRAGARLATPGGDHASLAYQEHQLLGHHAGSLIKLTVVVSAALFLGTIVLMKGAPAQATSGTFSKGASKRPGSADVTISAERFDDILADVGPFNSRIELAYNPTQGTVSDIFVEYD